MNTFDLFIYLLSSSALAAALFSILTHLFYWKVRTGCADQVLASFHQKYQFHQIDQFHKFHQIHQFSWDSANTSISPNSFNLSIGLALGGSVAIEGEHGQMFVATTSYFRGRKYHYCWNITLLLYTAGYKAGQGRKHSFTLKLSQWYCQYGCLLATDEITYNVDAC